MKNIAICKDAHCSNPSPAISPPQPTAVLNAVTCAYRVKPAPDRPFLVTVTWCRVNQAGFTFSVCDRPFSPSNLKSNSRALTLKRGSKAFDSGGLTVEVAWDLTRAKYATGPEPVSDFYVAVRIGSNACLMLGDADPDPEFKKRVRVSEHSLVSRGEHFSGDSVYSTRVKFCDKGTGHNILIKCGGERRNPVLSVYVDMRSVVQVRRLRWNFRGSQTIFVDGGLVDLMWDVYDWFFRPGVGCGVFLFRTRTGLDSRLWLEDRDFDQNGDRSIGFSLLIFACKNPV